MDNPILSRTASLQYCKPDKKQQPSISSNIASSYLQIASVPVEERINPHEPRYALLILPYGVRATGGQFRADEAYEIAKLTKGWDWRLDQVGRPRCLRSLEALLEQVCQSSARKGGEG